MSNAPQIIRAQPVSFAANATAPINLAFLDSAKGRNPMVRAIYAQVALNVTTNATVGGGRGAQLCQYLSRLILADGSGERVNLGGASLRVFNYCEDGFATGFDDPNDVAASTTANVSFVQRLPVVPSGIGAHREHDFYLPVRELRDGGRLEMSFGSGVFGNFTSINNGTITWFAEIVDQEAEVKSRLVLRENVMQQVDDVYTVGGALRHAIPYVGAAEENLGNAWATQNIDSFTLDYSQIPAGVFLERYKQANPSIYIRANAAGAVGALPGVRYFVDPFNNGFAVPFVTTAQFQKTTDLRYIPTVIHYRTSLGSIPSGALFLTSTIQPRTPRAAQLATGGSPALASEAIRSGKIAGSDKPAATVGSAAASILPVTVKR